MLQLLEPAVRPVAGEQVGTAKQGRTPFEARSFHDLLSEASAGEGGQGSGVSQMDQASNPLDGLGGLGQIENVTLRRVLMQARPTGGAE